MSQWATLVASVPMKSLQTEPAIAVVIAAWNAETTLRRAIESARAQTTKVEIIVIDDASTDGTLVLAQEIAAEDARITVLCQPVNQGPAAARNRAFATTTAEWVTILDSDDFMDAERLAKMLTLARGQDADFVADDLYKVTDDAPESRPTRMFTDEDIGDTWLTTASFVRSNLSSKHGGRRELGFLKPVIRRSFLVEHDLKYPDIKLGEDYVLYANALARQARFLLTDPAGYYAVVREESLSGSHPTHCHKELMQADRALLARTDLTSDARNALKAHLTEQHKKWAWRCLIDAKRERNLALALKCFRAPPSVVLDLFKRLVVDVTLRATGQHPGRAAS